MNQKQFSRILEDENTSTVVDIMIDDNNYLIDYNSDRGVYYLSNYDRFIAQFNDISIGLAEIYNRCNGYLIGLVKVRRKDCDSKLKKEREKSEPPSIGEANFLSGARNLPIGSPLLVKVNCKWVLAEIRYYSFEGFCFINLSNSSKISVTDITHYCILNLNPQD